MQLEDRAAQQRRASRRPERVVQSAVVELHSIARRQENKYLRLTRNSNGTGAEALRPPLCCSQLLTCWTFCTVVIPSTSWAWNAEQLVCGLSMCPIKDSCAPCHACCVLAAAPVPRSATAAPQQGPPGAACTAPAGTTVCTIRTLLAAHDPLTMRVAVHHTFIVIMPDSTLSHETPTNLKPIQGRDPACCSHRCHSMQRSRDLHRSTQGSDPLHSVRSTSRCRC